MNKTPDDWPWAGWGTVGMLAGFSLAFLVLFPLYMAGGPSWKYLALWAIQFGCAALGWRMAVRVGYRRNFEK